MKMYSYDTTLTYERLFLWGLLPMLGLLAIVFGKLGGDGRKYVAVVIYILITLIPPVDLFRKKVWHKDYFVLSEEAFKVYSYRNELLWDYSWEEIKSITAFEPHRRYEMRIPYIVVTSRDKRAFFIEYTDEALDSLEKYADVSEARGMFKPANSQLISVFCIVGAMLEFLLVYKM